jgi:hypothetical protein
MVVVGLTMVQQHTEIKEGTERSIIQSAQRIHERLGDPFMLYVQWIVAKAQNDLSTMARLKNDLKTSGFETAEMHRYDTEQAIAAKDSAKLKAALSNLAAYWDPSNQLNTPEVAKTIEQRWGYLAQQQSWEDEASQGGRGRPIGRLGPVGPGRSLADRSGPSRQPQQSPPEGFSPPQTRGERASQTGPESPSGRPRSPFRGRSPFGSRGGIPSAPSWQTEPENRIIITIEAESSFDINGLAKGLQSKLGSSGYGASRNNNRGTITMQYSGDLEQVRQAIDFGKAEIEDRDARRLRVRLTQ